MNDFDKNFHLNMSPLYAVFVFMLFMLWASEVKANDDVEEVIVVGQKVETFNVNPITSSRIISSIIPAFTYNAGGYGGFVGYNPSGAQLVHTSVLVNDVPANEPGSGWYDFGHDLATGQTVKVISGPNGVLYGSGSIAGTVLIEDTINAGLLYRYGDSKFLSVAPSNNIQFTKFSSTEEARNDNEEEDTYSNQSAKFSFNVGDFTIDAKYIDYEYDFDNCYTADLETSNNCLQDGDRYVISIRNENFTIGRSENNAEYFTDDVSTYINESSRDYFRFQDTVELSMLSDITYGLDYSNEQYGEITEDNYAGFVSANIDVLGNQYNFGIRKGNDSQDAYRLGFQRGLFYASYGTSFRKPNLYERYGDGIVQANPLLEPEEGIGYEIGFGTLGIFHYQFDQSIDFNFTDSVYYNAGDYKTQGAKYTQNFGPVKVVIRYTDTVQPRIAKYMAMLDYRHTFYNGMQVRAKYSVNLDREPGPFDGADLEDLEKLNFYLTQKWNNFTASLKIENVLDQEVEIVPFYNNEGREYYLTFNYIW